MSANWWRAGRSCRERMETDRFDFGTMRARVGGPKEGGDARSERTSTFFAGVVKHGGFSPASRALGVAKSRLSKHVARLELRLGVRLIERTTRRFQVTEPGEILFEQANAVVASADAAESLMASARSEPRGVVRVSCPPGLARQLEAVLPGFLQSYPHVRVHVTVVNRQVDLIDERIHVAVRVRAKLDTDPLFTVRVLGSVRSVLVASPTFLSRVGRALRCRGSGERGHPGPQRPPAEAAWMHLCGAGGADRGHHPRTPVELRRLRMCCAAAAPSTAWGSPCLPKDFLQGRTRDGRPAAGASRSGRRPKPLSTRSSRRGRDCRRPCGLSSIDWPGISRSWGARPPSR